MVEEREEELNLLTWRVERLEALRFPYPLALELARQNVPWHEAEDLILAGCDPQTAAEILKGDT